MEQFVIILLLLVNVKASSIMSVLNIGCTHIRLRWQLKAEWQTYLHVLVEHLTNKREASILQLLLCYPSHASLEVIIIHIDVSSSLGKWLHYKSSEPHWPLMICVTKCWVGAISMTVVQFSLVSCHRSVAIHLQLLGSHTIQRSALFWVSSICLLRSGDVVVHKWTKSSQAINKTFKDLSGDKNKFKLSLKRCLLYNSVYSLKEYFNS